MFVYLDVTYGKPSWRSCKNRRGSVGTSLRFCSLQSFRDNTWSRTQQCNLTSWVRLLCAFGLSSFAFHLSPNHAHTAEKLRQRGTIHKTLSSTTVVDLQELAGERGANSHSGSQAKNQRDLKQER